MDRVFHRHGERVVIFWRRTLRKNPDAAVREEKCLYNLMAQGRVPGCAALPTGLDRWF